MSCLKIKNVFNHANSQWKIRPGCTLVTGRNATGKTSFGIALGALATHDDNPMRLSLAQKHRYLRDGATHGVAILDRVEWQPLRGISAPPDAEPRATMLSVGLVDLTDPDRSAKDRAELWEELLLPKDPARLPANARTGANRRHLPTPAHLQDARENRESATPIYAARKAAVAREKLTTVRKALEEVNRVTGWMPVAIQEDYSITVGGRPVCLCAASERLQARFSLQIAFVMISRCDFLILDSTDRLRDESWDGLIRCLDRLAAREHNRNLHVLPIATSTSTPEGWKTIKL